MLKRFKRTADTPLDEHIAEILHKLRDCTDEEEYSRLLDKLERLDKLKPDSGPTRVSPDQLALVVGNLLGILVIVAYEQKHVMTSKGIGQLIRVRN